MQLKPALTSLLIAVFVLCLVIPSAAAHRGMTRGAQDPQYDPKTEVTIEGTVAEVQSQLMPGSPAARPRPDGRNGNGRYSSLNKERQTI